ncbi:MAG: clostripain-related cysteine peptidase [Armatimonadota bacterium]
MHSTSRYFLLLLALPLLAAVLSGCGGGGGSAGASAATPADLIYTEQEAEQHGAWTVLIYLDADNDLESAGINNFNQMEMVGSTKNVRVIVQMDRTPGYDSTNGDWTDTRRYLITRDGNTSTMHSVRLDNPALGEQDMGDWHTLKDFVDWGVSKFPADHYCLVIWDHGSGWTIRLNSAISQYKYVVSDETNSSGMNVTDIPLALADVNMDVVAFDACLMQQLEVAYELKDSAAYMVGSPAPEPSPGYDYSAILNRMGASTTPQNLCRVIVNEYAKEYPSYQGIIQSAVDLRQIASVADAASGFADILRSHSSAYAYQLAAARDNALNYSLCNGSSDRDSLDLLDYAYRCTQAIGASADDAYNELEQAIGNAVIAEAHNSDTPNAHGLAVYMPAAVRYDVRYGMLNLAQSTLWDEWIQAQTR